VGANRRRGKKTGGKPLLGYSISLEVCREGTTEEKNKLHEKSRGQSGKKKRGTRKGQETLAFTRGRGKGENSWEETTTAEKLRT